MKSPREITLDFEEANFSKYAQLSKNSRGRKREEEVCSLRTCYQKDRDKIIHCNSFRRLKQKTQVFISPRGDHYRTRLTHTLEVTQIARTIARALRLNEDLTEAIAMGHDLGHTPFGHAGERVLNSLNPNGFYHNIQSGRVVEFLERNLKGLNLSYEVIDGIKTHTGAKDPITREGMIVKTADRIAYINHDIEDAITAGILKESDLPKDTTDVLGNTKSQRITTLINSMVDNSAQEIKMEKVVTEKFLKLRQFMYDRVYIESEAKKEETKVDKLITDLYHYFKKDKDKLPLMYKNIIEIDGIDAAVTDYIQSMSDDKANGIFHDVFIPKSWHIK